MISTAIWESIGPSNGIGSDSMLIREPIVSEISQVAREQNKRLAPLADSLVLLESGLNFSALPFLYPVSKMSWGLILLARPTMSNFQ